MPLEPRRRIPALPDRPLVHAIAGKVHRSFQAGLQCFSRAFQGEVHTLTITNDEGFPPDVQAILLTSLNAFERATLVKSPFERTDERTLTCRVTPIRPGFHSFRIEFSMDGGRTWLRDNVPDAWVLVDPPQMDALTVYTFIPTISGSMEDWKLESKAHPRDGLQRNSPAAYHSQGYFREPVRRQGPVFGGYRLPGAG